MIAILKSKVLLIAKKEWYRFFSDRRMVISALILPGALLYFVYAFLAPIMINWIIGNDTKSNFYAINPPAVIQMLFEHSGINLIQIQDYEKEGILDSISQKNGNFLVIFPPEFDAKVTAYELDSLEEVPEIFLYYNSLSEGFIESFTKISTILSTYERSISKKFDINLSGGGDMANPNETGRHLLAAILPMFLLVFIYHGAIASTTEAITGEKEQGTLSTILITPITPMELVLGKIVGLGIESFLCGISGTLGILLSLPRFIASFNSNIGAEQDISSILKLDSINFNQYTVWDIMTLVLVLLSCSFFIVTLIGIVSINAKTAKEAQIILSPMTLIIMLIGLLGTLNNSVQNNICYNLIPIYNCLQSMSDIFNRVYTPLQILFTIGSNTFFSVFGTVILSRLFSNEKILSVT